MVARVIKGLLFETIFQKWNLGMLLLVVVAQNAISHNFAEIAQYKDAIFQADMPVIISGYHRSKTEEITIKLKNDVSSVERTGKVKNNSIHSFEAQFPAQPVGGPFTLSIMDTKDTITYDDIYFGEVWVCGGQSNMMFTMNSGMTGKEWVDAENDNDSLIRIPGKNGWEKMTSVDIIQKYPGTPYYFARQLRKKLNVPIGLHIWGVGGSSLWKFAPENIADRPELEYHYSILKKRNDWANQQNDAGVKNYRENYEPAIGFSPYPHPWFPFDMFSVWGSAAYNAKRASRGTIWWQGENDVGASALYEDLFRAFIQEYRKESGRGSDMPFVYVQLPTYRTKPSAPEEESMFGIAGLRDAQRKVLSEPNTAMAVTYDLYGSRSAIHPDNKNEVGERLANTVLGYVYKKDIDWQFPLYEKIESNSNGKIKIKFKNSGSGLRARQGDTDLKGFTIAGADKKFVEAKASVFGTDQIEVYSESVSNPKAVRYAWIQNPIANLVGDSDLPASPFRTDEWELYEYDGLPPRPPVSINSLYANQFSNESISFNNTVQNKGNNVIFNMGTVVPNYYRHKNYGTKTWDLMGKSQ